MTAPVTESADAWKDIPSGKRLGNCPSCGRDSCDNPSHAPTNGKTELPDSTVGDFISAEDITKAPPPEHVVEDMVIRGGITLMSAESGVGKTFVVMSISGAVCEDTNWYGRDVTHGSVAYVGYEADAWSLRTQALQEQGYDLTNLYFLRAADPISPSVQRDGTETSSIGEDILVDRLERLAKKIKEEGKPPIALLAIDTVRTSIVGSEDRSDDISAYLRVLRRVLLLLPGAGALLLHHSGWQDGEQKRKRERGSSAFRGNVDVTLYLEVTDGTDPAAVHLELKTLKIRDSEKRVPLRLIRRKVDLPGFDKFGNPLSSCIIERNPKSYKEVIEEKQAADAEAEKIKQEELQNKILGLIRKNDHLTNQDQIRELLGVGKNKVVAAIAVLLQKKLVFREKQRAPYQATDAGKRERI